MCAASAVGVVVVVVVVVLGLLVAGMIPSWSCCWSAEGTLELALAPPSWLISELASVWGPLPSEEEISDEVEEAEDEFDMVELVLEADEEEDDGDEEVLRSRHWLMHEARAACGSTSWPLNLTPLAMFRAP